MKGRMASPHKLPPKELLEKPHELGGMLSIFILHAPQHSDTGDSFKPFPIFSL